jgi:hypothetical protein
VRPLLLLLAVLNQPGISFHFCDYLELVDWTGLIVRKDKLGYIPSHIPPILTRLNIHLKDWLNNSQQFESRIRWSFAKRIEYEKTG